MTKGDKIYYSGTYSAGTDGYWLPGTYLCPIKISSPWSIARHYVLDENGNETEAASVRPHCRVNFIRVDKNSGRFRQEDGSFGDVVMTLVAQKV